MSDRQKIKQLNIAVWRNTYDIFEKKLTHVKPEDAILYFDKELNVVDMKPKYDKTETVVENMDTFTMSDQFLKDGYNPVALNMASNYFPGGGYRKGSSAQEENLFRRSNYYKCLPKDFYPLNIDQVIYSPKVCVIKDNDYNLMSKGFFVSCLACAALRKPKLSDDFLYLLDNDREIMEMKIRMIFKVAYLHEHDSMILGALGCGAFGNPPQEVVNIFNDCLLDYSGCFKKIGFAIYSIHDDNYTIFNNGLVR